LIVPILHYTMECAAAVRCAFLDFQPDCVAVELPETLEAEALRAAERLPETSVIEADDLYLLAEPCDAAFEGLRSAIESGIAAHCIDLDVAVYPDFAEPFPDPYAIHRIGLTKYAELCQERELPRAPQDEARELHMARRLKELSLRYDRVLFVCGLAHAKRVQALLDRNDFPNSSPPLRDARLCTLSDQSRRDVMSESGWITTCYEIGREAGQPVDRQHLLYLLYEKAAKRYEGSFEGYHLRNLMKYVRNTALLSGRLMPDLYQILTAAKLCVDDNFAYAVWELATSYPQTNIDNLPELDLTAEQVWGASRQILFRLKQRKSKGLPYSKRREKSRSRAHFAPGPFFICSYPPEDVTIERFGNTLRQRGTTIASEEHARVVPFTTSLEDGIDVRETIRHWRQRELYVRVNGKPPGPTGSVVLIFDPESMSYPWTATWHGEHDQESDMAFYATDRRARIVGPGISRCRYGGLMMTYPPRRLLDIWSDSDYSQCRNGAEMLLMAAIDYAIDPVVVYVAAEPPRSWYKSYAARSGKKLIYLPLGSLSPTELNRIRHFHVLDGHDKREIAKDFIE
jgi:hypothetical protein